MIRTTRLNRIAAGAAVFTILAVCLSAAWSQTPNDPKAVQVPDIKITFAHPPDAPSPFGGDLPREAEVPPAPDAKEHGVFADIVANHISALNVTWSDPARFKSEEQTEDLLRQLLSSPNTQTWRYHVWQFGDAIPCAEVTVEHVAGKQGRWVVWCPPPGLYWAYLDGDGKWWWGQWNVLKAPLPRSMGAQAQAPSTRVRTFPVLPRIADADPSVVHEVTTQIPTKLRVSRTSDTLSIAFDSNSSQAVKLMVGKNMITGVETALRVYPERTNRPSQSRGMGFSSSLDFGSGTVFLNASQDGMPLPGKSYTIEESLTVFETDVPEQHMWSPKNSPNYRVLWQAVVKQIVD
jgi:hypothetical protein